MDCTDVKALLSQILDGGLAADERHRAERHLADCADCRRLVSEAELADTLVAAAIDIDDPADGLPEGFEGAVLARTVYAAGRGGNRWHSWLGWLAAAASIVLAVVLWPLGRTTTQPARESGAPMAAATERPPAQDTKPAMRLVVNEVARYAGDTGGAAYHPAVVRKSAPAPATGDASNDLSRRDADTIDSLSMVLSIIANADDQSFADVEQARRITEYEQLLPRLAETREDVAPADRPALLAAEAMLYRVVRGPLDLDDVRELRNTIARLDLPDRIDAITGERVRPSSL